MSRYSAAYQRTAIRVCGVVSAVVLLLWVSTAAAAPVKPVTRLLACRVIAADAARLRCFDRAAAVLAQAAGAARPTAASTGTAAARRPFPSAVKAEAPAKRAATAFDPRQTFGLSPAAILAREGKAGARRKAISHITARVTHLQQAPDGRMLYWLANGQVWEELAANGDAPPLKTGQPVRISRGWLGSYWLQTPSGRGCKVQRLR